MDEMIRLMNQLGVQAGWIVILYKLADTIETLVVFGFIGWGIKKAWKPFTEAIKHWDD